MKDAYVVPIETAFDDIKQRLGAKSVSLPNGFDIEQWLSQCTPWLSKEFKGVPNWISSAHSNETEPRLDFLIPASPTTDHKPTIMEAVDDDTGNRPEATVISVDSYDHILDSFALEGYELTNVLTRSSSTWEGVCRSPMRLSQEALKALVLKQRSSGNSADDLLSDSTINGNKRSQVLRLLDDLALRLLDDLVLRDHNQIPRDRLAYLRSVDDMMIQIIVLTNASKADAAKVLNSRAAEVIYVPGVNLTDDNSRGNTASPPKMKLCIKCHQAAEPRPDIATNITGSSDFNVKALDVPQQRLHDWDGHISSVDTMSTSTSNLGKRKTHHYDDLPSSEEAQLSDELPYGDAQVSIGYNRTQSSEDSGFYDGDYSNDRSHFGESQTPDTAYGSLSKISSIDDRSNDLRGGAKYYCFEHRYDYSTSRYHDLERHKIAKHTSTNDILSSGPRLDCPYGGCGHKGINGFKRKDHLRDHCKRYHRRDLPKSMGGSGRKIEAF